MIIERPLICTGTVTAPCGAVAEEVVEISTELRLEGSGGRDLKKLSSFFDSSLLLCLVQPTLPFLVRTRNHFNPFAPCISATGVTVSPLRIHTPGGENSSGVVNSRMSDDSAMDSRKESICANACGSERISKRPSRPAKMVGGNRVSANYYSRIANLSIFR